MTFTRKPYAVEAEQIREPKFINTQEGQIYAHVGQWRITEANGDEHLCDDEEFHLKYAAASVGTVA